MISFVNDYSEGAHERIMEVLLKTNREQTAGYGMDEYCTEARQLIMNQLHHEESQVHFLVGGTQTNMTVIAAFLRPHQGVVSADSGHVNVHESGAIEATGHKVLALPSKDGKINAQEIRTCLQDHFGNANFEHMVQPGMVYISDPTEVGTIYTKKEITDISVVCQENEIPLYVDGARLGCALTCPENDLTLSDLACLTDAFYIGGTKMGALFGEALVINNPRYGKDFRYILKQRGGMLAKGRLLGIQFAELFRDSLYFDLARHANEMAQKLQKEIGSMGYSFAFHSPTNQIFPIFSDKLLEEIGQKYKYEYWARIDQNSSMIRLCCSWATEEKNVDAFLSDLKKLSNK